MGAWEEQAKQTNEHRQHWSQAQEFNFIQVLLVATNEEEVKAAYVREFSLPVKTQERHDLVVNKILFEFKYSVKLGDIEVAAKVIAQAIYYINRLFKKGRIDEIKYFIVADKDEARIFKVIEFRLFYESYEYQWDDFRPSSPDPKLIAAIKNSKLLESNRVYRLTSQDDLHIFSTRIYKILSPNNYQIKSNNQKHLGWSLPPFLIIICGLTLIVSSGIVLRNHHYFDFLNKLTPAHNNK
ncbi:hypothetical protein F8R90_13550 [Nostoc sp. NZL]|nr:hypothetical protein [Nostoc sp. NZL]